MKSQTSNIQQAISDLNSGKVVGIPTETVYGLAASIQSLDGIDTIFKTKERPFFDPLIVHVSSVDQAKSCTISWNDKAEKLAEVFWPGPLTMILPKVEIISDKITSGLETVGIRMPDHKLTLDLIDQLGHPIAAPSANKFKKTSPTNADHVKASFSEILVLDGGQCEVGIESTIVGFENNLPVIYRPGMITKENLESCLGCEVKIKESPVAPGHLKHHYMPETPIILCLDKNQENLSNLVDKSLTASPKIWPLPVDPVIAARTLYSSFRNFDSVDSTSIVITYNSEQKNDLNFEGIFNRLQKAASYTI